MTGQGNGGNTPEVLFEFTRVGQQMRVAAFDVTSGTEVIVVAPVSATQFQMQNLALAKLKRRLSQTP